MFRYNIVVYDCEVGIVIVKVCADDEKKIFDYFCPVELTRMNHLSEIVKNARVKRKFSFSEELWTHCGEAYNFL